MTPRQQRRLEQKLARKAAKRALKMGAISEAKLAANQANAQHSTGPVSDQGKAIVSQNATKHGLTGKFKVLACESQAEFDQLLSSFLKSEAPVGDDEIQMVHQMAESLWLSRRSVRLQNECFAALESGTPESVKAAHKSLALYLRYQTTHDRTFTRYATELRKRRNERARTERGFVSQKHKEAAEQCRQETHERRQALQILRAEALQLKNLAKKTHLTAAA